MEYPNRQILIRWTVVWTRQDGYHRAWAYLQLKHRWTKLKLKHWGSIFDKWPKLILWLPIFHGTLQGPSSRPSWNTPDLKKTRSFHWVEIYIIVIWNFKDIFHVTWTGSQRWKERGAGFERQLASSPRFITSGVTRVCMAENWSQRGNMLVYL